MALVAQEAGTVLPLAGVWVRRRKTNTVYLELSGSSPKQAREIDSIPTLGTQQHFAYM